MELNANEINVTITPYLRYFKNSILYPLTAAASVTITFAAAPIIVMLPPRQAPNDKHHHSGLVYAAPICAWIVASIGALVVRAYALAHITPKDQTIFIKNIQFPVFQLTFFLSDTAAAALHNKTAIFFHGASWAIFYTSTAI